MPVTVRDRANREFLAAEKSRLSRLLDTVPTETAAKLVWPAFRERVLRELQHIRVIENGLAMGGRNGRPPAYLLAFVTSGLGQAVISFGDPDRADRVVACTPGLNTKLSSFGGDFNKAAVLWDQAHYLSPGQRIASIAWLGYRPPQLDGDAATPGKTVAGDGAAATGAVALANFTDGLRASHAPGSSAKLTMLGHSYGSLVTGKAAVLRSGRFADDLVFVGSPGVGVQRAEELGVPPSHVWAGEAGGDPVADLGHFGEDPCDPPFGAQRFQVEHGPFYLTLKAHSIYWDRGSRSLENLGHIVVGQYPQVRTRP